MIVLSRGMVAVRALLAPRRRFGQWKPCVALLLRGDARGTQGFSAVMARSQALSGVAALR